MSSSAATVVKQGNTDRLRKAAQGDVANERLFVLYQCIKDGIKNGKISEDVGAELVSKIVRLHYTINPRGKVV